jgi:GT2 family glycosyltransferase
MRGDVRVVDVALPGVARARQRALDESATDVVLFLDDDVVPRAGWYTALSAAADAPEVGAAGGTVAPLWPDHSPPRWLDSRLYPYFGERRAGPGNPHLPFGANVAVRRDAAAAVGGYRLDLGKSGDQMGMHEDTELCRRIREGGWRVEEAPDAVVDHLVSPDSLQPAAIVRRAWAEGRADRTADSVEYRVRRAPRAAKAIGSLLLLIASLPSPRRALYRAARLAANSGYLAPNAPGHA